MQTADERQNNNGNMITVFLVFPGKTTVKAGHRFLMSYNNPNVESYSIPVSKDNGKS